MISRFVVVPANSKETGSMRNRASFCKTAPMSACLRHAIPGRLLPGGMAVLLCDELYHCKNARIDMTYLRGFEGIGGLVGVRIASREIGWMIRGLSWGHGS